MSQVYWMEEEGLRSQQRRLKAHKDPHKWLVRAMNELCKSHLWPCKSNECMQVGVEIVDFGLAQQSLKLV